jgi:hypothetical protein
LKSSRRLYRDPLLIFRSLRNIPEGCPETHPPLSRRFWNVTEDSTEIHPQFLEGFGMFHPSIFIRFQRLVEYFDSMLF